MEQIHPVNNKIIQTTAVSVQIWVLASLCFGFECFLYTILAANDIDEWVSIAGAFFSAVGTLPLLIILHVALEEIRASTRTPVGKMKRLLLLCLMFVLPYAFIAGCVFNNTYGSNLAAINFIIHVMSATAILYACSIAALLLTGSKLTQFFSQTPPGQTYLDTQIGKQIIANSNTKAE